MYPGYELAQVNVARLRTPVTSGTLEPMQTTLADALERINALADDAPGFVWRLKTNHEHALTLRPYEDDQIVVNLSVWRSAEALKSFVYRGRHADVIRLRAKLFEPIDGAFMAMWWVPQGHRPTIREACDRLDVLRRTGASARAFSFAQVYPPTQTVHPPVFAEVMA